MSDKTRTFTVVKLDGKLHPTAPKAYEAFVASIADGEAYTVTYELEGARRSNRANRFYFGVVLKAISEHTGYEVDELHEVFAMKFLRIEDDPLTGVPRRKRTPKTTSDEFKEYVDQVIRFAAMELDVVIPDSERAA